MLLLAAALTAGVAQETHVIHLFFRYGSVAAPGHEDPDYEEVGGIFGGHVSLGIDSSEVGFTNHRRIHLFGNSEFKNSHFYRKSLREFQDKTKGKKYVTFEIPVTAEQYEKLKVILDHYIEQSPYDYAFFGMRCTSATYEVLSQIGLFPALSKMQNIFVNFYPELLRRKMFRLANDQHYAVIQQPGVNTRIWDED